MGRIKVDRVSVTFTGLDIADRDLEKEKRDAEGGDLNRTQVT